MNIRKYLSLKKLSTVFTNRLGSLRVGLNRATGSMAYLPTVFVSVTDRCNSRCASCSLWQSPGETLAPAVIEQSVAALRPLGLKYVVITGGEPLVRDDLSDILDRLSGMELKLILCTNGMLLRRRREAVLKYFDSVVVSLDSHERASYKTIRGVDAFDEVVAGIATITEAHMPVTIAHTLQRGTILHLAEFIRFAKGLGVESVSVRPLDAYSAGFGSAYGQIPSRNSLLPSDDEIAGFSEVLALIRKDFPADLMSGFIAPSIGGLRKIRDYFLAKTDDSFPCPRCDAPVSTCVIESNGDIKPCFFSESFANVHLLDAADMKRFLNSGRARMARKGLHRRGAICRRCAYPYMWL